MPVTIFVNGLSLCHKGCGGSVSATLPDVCKTPTGAGPAPIPYPNVSFSKFLANGTRTVLVDGGNMAANKGSEFSRSQGDEPGTLGGVKSGVNMDKATWLSWSTNVKMEGRNACRHTDKMLMNRGNTASLGGFVNRPAGPDDIIYMLCELACACKDADYRQQCMRKKIEQDLYKGRYPKDDSPVWREVSMQRGANGGWEIIQNRAGTAPTSNPITPRGGIRPDLILTDSASNPSRMIEVKFPGDTLRPTQKAGNAYDRAAKDLGIDYDVMEVEDTCDFCWDPPPPPPPVPVAEPAPTPSSEWNAGQIAGVVLVVGVGVAAVACYASVACGAAVSAALAGAGEVLLPAGGAILGGGAA